MPSTSRSFYTTGDRLQTRKTNTCYRLASDIAFQLKQAYAVTCLSMPNHRSELGFQLKQAYAVTALVLLLCGMDRLVSIETGLRGNETRPAFEELLENRLRLAERADAEHGRVTATG